MRNKSYTFEVPVKKIKNYVLRRPTVFDLEKSRRGTKI